MDVLLVTAAGGITECDCTLSGGSLAGCGTELQEAAGIEDDVEVMVKDILRCGGEMNDPDVIRAWATSSGETVDWLEELGCEISETIVNASSNSIDRCHRSLPVGDGLGWMLGLEKAIEERDLNVMFETRARSSTAMKRDVWSDVLSRCLTVLRRPCMPSRVWSWQPVASVTARRCEEPLQPVYRLGYRERPQGRVYRVRCKPR